MNNSLVSANSVVAEETNSNQQEFFPNSHIDYSLRCRPHRPSSEQGTYFPYTMTHSQIEARLTPCASLLYHWLLAQPVPAGGELRVDLKDFQGFTGEYRIVRNKRGREIGSKPYSDRQIFAAVAELRKLELITDYRVTSVRTIMRLQHPGPVQEIVPDKERRLRKSSERLQKTAVETSETPSETGSLPVQITEQITKEFKKNSAIDLDTRAPSAPSGAGEKALAAKAAPAETALANQYQENPVQALTSLLGNDGRVAGLLGDALNEPPLVGAYGVAPALVERLRESEIQLNQKIIAALIRLSRSGLFPWVANTWILAAFAAFEEALASGELRKPIAFLLTAISEKYRPNYPEPDLRDRLVLLDRLNSPEPVPVPPLVAQSQPIVSDQPPTNSDIPEKPTKPPAQVVAEVAAQFRVLGLGSTPKADPLPFRNAKRLLALDLDDLGVTGAIREFSQEKIAQALDWTEASIQVRRLPPGGTAKIFLGYLESNPPPDPG